MATRVALSLSGPRIGTALSRKQAKNSVDRPDRNFPLMATRRVVVTGLGLLSPLGISVKHSWKRLIAGESGTVSLLDHPSTTNLRNEYAALPSTVAGIVPEDSWMEKLSRDDQRKMGRFAQLAIAASEEALSDAGIDTKELSLEERERIVHSEGRKLLR